MGAPIPAGFKYAHINSNTTTNLITSTGSGNPLNANPPGSVGLLGAVIVNSPGATWTITVYDGPNGTGNIVKQITNPTAAIEGATVALQMTTGLSVVTSGTTPGDVTIAYA